MIPRNEIYGIDLASDWQYILKQLTRCSHAFVPVYQENMDHVKGMLNLLGYWSVENHREEILFHNQTLKYAPSQA